MTNSVIKIATRSSELALWQANAVGRALGQEYELVHVISSGDKDLSSPLTEIGGAGVFVKEVQLALLDGRADVAVHSAKDLPGETTEGLLIAGYLPRGDARDVLVGTTLTTAKRGATIATGSARRRALLLAKRPDLKIVQLRGNIRTRLAHLGEVDGVVIAKAALDRLEIVPELYEVFDPSDFCPQIGQGAIAIETTTQDVELAGRIYDRGDPETFSCVTAERALLKRLGAGCSLPVGAYSYLDAGSVVLFGMVSSHDGTQIVSATFRSADPEKLGFELGSFILDNGGNGLLSTQSDKRDFDW